MADGIPEPVAVRPGFCSIAVRQLSTDEVLRLAENSGAAGIEWGADVHVPPGDAAGARRLAERCRDAGIECVSYGTYLQAGTADVVHRLDPVLDVAEALGVGNIRIWGELGITPDAASDERRRVVDGVRAIVPLITGRGFTASLEYHRRTITATAESAVALSRQIDDPHFFLYWQPDGPGSVADLVAEFRSVAARVSHVHLFAWRSYEDRYPLVAWQDLWREILRHCREPGSWGRDRFALIEHVADDRPDQLAADLAALRSWISVRHTEGENRS
ncbi:TIM barrel protein [Pseudonocardia sp.]|uniref:sugar phosphate isomerase/epimerase family protein n=1 Tax=Pseudonocardia sp. TaxID=60912 RepID=UPI0026179403|nr:TIM barrel protein [Pseudonocardia sp.]